MVKKASDIIPDFFGSFIMKDARRITKLFASWGIIAEKLNISAAADHSRIVELERNIIFIEADHPGWIQILQTKQREILNSFRREFPRLTIAGVSFRLGKRVIPPRAGCRELLRKLAELDKPAPPPEEKTENIFETDERLKSLILKFL